jgi:hypothetical protein
MCLIATLAFLQNCLRQSKKIGALKLPNIYFPQRANKVSNLRQINARLFV